VVSITSSGRASKKLINRQEFIEDFNSDDELIDEKSKSKKDKTKDYGLEEDKNDEGEAEREENDQDELLDEDEEDEDFVPEANRNKEILNYDKIKK
jgi:hypothetical protein